MGSGKQYKTGSVVGSYPRPLLCLNFDEGGLDIIKEPIEPLKPEQLPDLCKKKSEELKPISMIDFCDVSQKLMLEAFKTQASSGPFKAFVSTVNTLIKVGCPWRTVVVDSVSGLGDAILSHMAEVSGTSMESALKWAPMCGSKIHQTLGVLNSLQAHTVFICHSSSPEKDETTSVTSVVPLVPSKWLRDRIGTLVSQFGYQIIENGKAVLYTTNSDAAFVKGIGFRWPENLPTKVGADYKSIYETHYPPKGTK